MKNTIAGTLYLLPVSLAGALALLPPDRHGEKFPVPSRALGVVIYPSHLAETIRGWEVYNAQGCSSCHSIDQVGNLAAPLDDVGARRRPAELREWITGTGSAAERLSPAVRKEKQRYRELPEDDMRALVVYLTTLTVKP